MAEGGNGSTMRSLSGIVLFSARLYLLRMRRRSVMLEEVARGAPEPGGAGRESGGSTGAAGKAAGKHRNTLRRQDFTLPAERFAAGRGAADVNLIDTLEKALAERVGNHVWVIRPSGSVVYARRDGEVLWDLISDIDLWCFVAGDMFSRRSKTTFLHDLREGLARFLAEARIRTTFDARRDLYLLDRRGKGYLVDVKLAELGWLTEGIAGLDRGSITLGKRRREPYVALPKEEWAVYRFFENHFPSEAAREIFRKAVQCETMKERRHMVEYVYLDNYVEALRAMKLTRVLKAILLRRKFEKYVSLILKKILFLGHLRRDAALRERALVELERTPVPDGPGRSMASRIRYLRLMIDLLEDLRVVRLESMIR
jgi:hypothetical protein